MKNFWKNNILLIFLVVFISFAQADSLFYTFDKIKKNEKIIYIPVRFDSCSIGLALSGGGARGAAHLGILKKMKEYGLPVSRLSGTSIGAVVGALIIAGYTPDQILSILENSEWDKLYNNKADRTNIIVPLKKQSDNYFINLLLSEKGPFIPISLSHGQKLIDRLARYVYGLTFYYYHNYDKMAIPFRIIATDLLTGKKVVMDRGPLTLNLLASMSYPLLFAPVELDQKMLIDGGIAENIPVDELIGKVNLIFASDVTAGLRGREFLRAPWQIADQVTTIMMKYNKEKLENADFVFQPPVKDYSSTDFHMMEQFVNFGERNFDMALPNIKKILENKLKRPVIFEKLYIHDLSIYSPTTHFDVKIDTILSLNMLVKHLSLFYGNAPDSLIYTTKNQTLKLFYSRNRVYENLHIYKEGKLIDVVKPVSLAVINSVYPSAFRDPVQFGKFLLLKKGFLVKYEKQVNHKNTLEIYYRSQKINQNEVKIDLVSKTRPYVLKREIVFPDSGTSHRDALLTSIQNLYGLDLFRRVLVYYVRDTSTINEAQIHIFTEDKPLTNLKIGISANKNLKGELGFALVNNNLAGHNLSFITNGVIGTRRRYISFRFNTNRIGYTYTGLFAGYRTLWESRDLYLNHKNSGKFSYTRDEISVGLAKFLEKLGYTTVSVYFRNEYGPSDITLLDNARYKSVGLRLESIVDKRDFIPIANRGIYSHLAMESSSMFRGNREIRYNKFEIELRWFRKIWKYSTINPFFAGGIMENQVPFLTWFGTDGTNRKLGWNIYENYGKVYGIWGFNFYQKIFPYVWGEKYLKLSMDWGNFWHDSETGFNWNEIKPGMGIAFIISTIVGPVEISYELNEDNDKFFWFSLGYNF